MRLDPSVGRNAEANGVESGLRRIPQKYSRFNYGATRSYRAGAAGFVSRDLAGCQANLIDRCSVSDRGQSVLALIAHLRTTFGTPPYWERAAL